MASPKTNNSIAKPLKCKIRKGDTVRILAGRDRGKIGTVLKVLPRESRVLVQGVGQVVRHVAPTRDSPEGGRKMKESTIHISNVAYWDDKAQKAVRIGYKIDDAGKKVRVSKKSGSVL